MRIVDMHSHWGTRTGYPFRTPQELAQQEKVWRSKPSYVTEREMADYFRQANVKVILDLGFTKSLPIDEVREYHDYAIRVQKEFPDVILGSWLQINPRSGRAGVNELKRCIGSGFIGFCVSGAAVNCPASDSAYDPFYELCIEAGVPVLILVGYTGAGAGLPGGKGMRLELCHPRYVDEVAARYPDLKIVAGRPAWPWQADMIAVLLHKPNVWYELHGWSPKYFTPDLKWEISRRLQNRVMFGADYPLFRYERLVRDWEAEGYGQEILEKVFFKNAETFLASLSYRQG
jgi:predicted TIM-barrel fold metal-dependent hydrolase